MRTSALIAAMLAANTALLGGCGGQNENPRPDNGADAQHGQLEGTQGSVKGFLFGRRQDGVERLYAVK